jgi:hypothetical protein
VKLLTSIAISIAASAAIATGVTRYVAMNAAAPAFWQHDPVAILWLAAGGPVVIGLVVFALAAFFLVTIGMLRDLFLARARLEWHDADGSATQPDWVVVFEGTALAPIADQLVSDEFRVAPLSLLRVLRIEVWRVYAKRLVCMEILAIAASAGLALIRPAWLSAPSAAAGSGWELAAALLLLAAVAAAWLVMDEAIGRMGGAITRGSAAWPRPVATVESAAVLPPHRVWPDPSQSRIEHLLAAVERLIDALAARPDPGARIAGELALARTELRPLLERLDERLRAPPAPQIEHDESIWPQALASITGALSDLARAMEKLSIEAVAGRWDELEAAVRTMGTSLDTITTAMQTQPPRDPGPRSVTDKLEELLEEISDRDFDPRPSTRAATG